MSFLDLFTPNISSRSGKRTSSLEGKKVSKILIKLHVFISQLLPELPDTWTFVELFPDSRVGKERRVLLHRDLSQINRGHRSPDRVNQDY